jgi:hypothetical protein
MRFLGGKRQKKKADPLFDFAQGRLFEDDNKKGNGEEKNDGDQSVVTPVEIGGWVKPTSQNRDVGRAGVDPLVPESRCRVLAVCQSRDFVSESGCGALCLRR